MNLKTLSFLFAALFTLVSCGNQPATTDEASASMATTPSAKAPATFADKVAAAHARADFKAYEAVQFDIQLFFGGSERLNGTITLSTDSRRGVVATKDGTQVFFQDSKVFCAPETENMAGTRFMAYTWAYFYMLPYKLNDPGTVWNDYPDKKLNDKTYLTSKLSFEPGTGDAPDDWYVLYADPDSKLLQVAAYIVTAGQDQAEAEKDPHAIEYLNYQTTGGIPIATEWKFWGWQADQGLTDQLGNANLSNIRLLKSAGDVFTPPTNFIEG